jgi:DNA-directed RNA polymerase specialized sigma24 family protein
VDPISQLEQEWSSLAGGELARELRRWRAASSALQRFSSPEELVAYLQRSRPEATDAPLHALLWLAADDRAAGRLCLQAILPALKSLSARLLRSGLARDEGRALLLAAAWEAICTYPLGRRRRVAANLVLQVLHDASRELRRLGQAERALYDAAQRLEETSLRRGPAGALELGGGECWSAGGTFAGPAPGADKGRRGELGVEGVVAAAALAAGLRPEDQELVLLTRVDGLSLSRVAAERGVSEAALRKRRQRAEARLREALIELERVRKRPLTVLTKGEGRLRPDRRRRSRRGETVGPERPGGSA